jgi:flagellar basal-body rod protein FlgB
MNDLDRMFLPVQKALGFSAASTEAVFRNIANANTPNYRRVQVSFEQLLEAAQLDSRVRRFKALEKAVPELTTDQDTPAGANGNNVTLEKELTDLQRQMLLHEFAVRVAAGKYQGMRTAIAGRS